MKCNWMASISIELEMISHSCQFIKATIVDVLFEMNVAASMVQLGLGFAQQGEFGPGLDHLNPERVAAHLSTSSID